MTTIVPIIIVGAGPVGLSVSMALSRIWGSEQQIRQSELPVTARRFLWMNHLKGEIQCS